MGKRIVQDPPQSSPFAFKLVLNVINDKAVLTEGRFELSKQTAKSYFLTNEDGRVNVVPKVIFGVVSSNFLNSPRTVNRQIEYFNLDVIISVGYRVNSLRGSQFRIWATQRLREYIVKGFTMDDERLKAAGGGNYFDERLRQRCLRGAKSIILSFGLKSGCLV